MRIWFQGGEFTLQWDMAVLVVYFIMALKKKQLEKAVTKKSSAHSELSRKGWLALLLLMREKGNNAAESSGRVLNTLFLQTPVELVWVQYTNTWLACFQCPNLQTPFIDSNKNLYMPQYTCPHPVLGEIPPQLWLVSCDTEREPHSPLK